ncbi:hypothetical protein [Pseudomonas purpurea]|uniref:hypothetical protein n=1 Tax=Pseudomonas purpurea TaxID=3136737 RepID=UPI0032665C72
MLKTYRVVMLSMLSALASACVHAEPLEACGVAVPDIPGFELSVTQEDGICYGKLVSRVALNPGILEEENTFMIHPVPFQQQIEASGRFDATHRYRYRYDVDEVIAQVSGTSEGSIEQRRLLGTALVRITMSPFVLWASDEAISQAMQTFSIPRTGLLMDCFYGVAGVGEASVTLSACVPRSTDSADPRLDDIKSAFNQLTVAGVKPL